MLSNEVVQSLLRAECADMFSVLGMHEVKDGLAVRAFLPGIADAAVVERGGQRRWPMQRTRDEGLFEVDIDSETQLFAYALEVVDLGGGPGRPARFQFLLAGA